MSGSGWQDRRFMFPSSREVHEPSKPRRASDTSITESIARTITNQSTESGTSATKTIASPVGKATGAAGASAYGSTGQRRRSSAASQAGMFSGLMGHKRGSDDYSQRRSSIEEMEGKSGMIGSLWNSTFRGMQNKPQDSQKDTKRGVME